MFKQSHKQHVKNIAQFRRRSIFWSAIAISLMFSMAMWSYTYVNRLKADLGSFVSNYQIHTPLLNTLTKNVHELEWLIEEISTEKDPSRLQNLQMKYQQVFFSVGTTIEQLGNETLLENEKRVIDEFKELFKQSAQSYQKNLANMKEGGIGLSKSYSEMIVFYDSFLEKLESLMIVERKNNQSIAEELKSETDQFLFVSIIISSISLLIVILIAIRILRFSYNQKSKLLVALDDVDESYNKLEVFRKELESANKIRMEFIANMSHELRTPMTSIKGALGILNSDMIAGIPAEAQNLCQIADDKADHLMALITDVLDFSKIEAGDLKLENKAFDPRQAFNHNIETYMNRAKNKNIAFKTVFDHLMPETICSDVSCLNQILNQLLSNAVKFTERGAIELEFVYLSRERQLKVFIVDSGIGLSDEASSHLFEYFVQGDGSSTRKHGGTGLGLAICKRLVDAMGGEIGAENNGNGRGSTFWFTVATVEEVKAA